MKEKYTLLCHLLISLVNLNLFWSRWMGYFNWTTIINYFYNI